MQELDSKIPEPCRNCGFLIQHEKLGIAVKKMTGFEFTCGNTHAMTFKHLVHTVTCSRALCTRSTDTANSYWGNPDCPYFVEWTVKVKDVM